MTSNIPADEVAVNNTERNAWVMFDGCVYDVTSFLSIHPGGKKILLQHAGQDITALMSQKGVHMHSKAAYSILNTYKIGEVQREENKLKDLEVDGWKEDTIDWSKGMVSQVHTFGHNYIRWVHSPVNKKLRLFQSNFLEFFSKTPWYIIPLVWLPIIIYLLNAAFVNLTKHPLPSDGVASKAVIIQTLLTILVFVGIFLWTVVEYTLHRFLFHLTPPGDSPFWITLHFFLHGQHHKVPFDEGRLVFPPVAASFIVWPFYVLFVNVLPVGIAQGIFGGGLLGYVIYDMTHYYLHHGQPSKGGYFHRLKQYHMQHHFNDHNKGFGISSTLWDGPFGTAVAKSK